MTKKASPRQQAERQERIDQILAAGRRLFLEKGYLGATVRDIAMEAELSTGTLYFYFKGKDEIYGRVCEDAFHILLGLFRRAAVTSGSPLEKLEALSLAYVKFYTEYPDYFDILSFRDMGFKKVGLSVERIERLDQFSAQSIDILEAAVQDGIRNGDLISNVSSRQMAMALWGGIEGILSLHKRGYLTQYGLDLQEVVQSQNRILFNGVRVR